MPVSALIVAASVKQAPQSPDMTGYVTAETAASFKNMLYVGMVGIRERCWATCLKDGGSGEQNGTRPSSLKVA